MSFVGNSVGEQKMRVFFFEKKIVFGKQATHNNERGHQAERGNGVYAVQCISKCVESGSGTRHQATKTESVVESSRTVNVLRDFHWER